MEDREGQCRLGWKLVKSILYGNLWKFPESSIFSFFFFSVLFIYLYLAVLGLHALLRPSLITGSVGCSSLPRTGFSLCWLLCCKAQALGAQLQQLQHVGYVDATCRLSCLAACESSQTRDGLNLCPRHWQVDSYSLLYQGNLRSAFLSSAEKMDHSIFNRSTVRIKGKWMSTLL